MNKKANIVLVIIALILGIGGLGLGGYSFYNTLMISNELQQKSHKARVYLTSSYSVSSSSWFTIDFDAIEYNVGGNYDLLTDSFNVTSAGYYLISGMVTFVTLGVDYTMGLSIHKNGTLNTAGYRQSSYETIQSLNIVDILYLLPGDWIRLKVFHNDPIDRFILGNELYSYTYLSIILIDE